MSAPLMDRVAQAIYDMGWDIISRERAEGLAFIALTALRYPTPTMIRAGERETTPTGCWQAMLEAGLREEET